MFSTTPAETHRQIVLAEQSVDYLLRRSRRRTIGLTIDHRGLRVGAPVRASLRDIEALIQQHGQWVLDKLTEWRERPTAKPTPIVDGTSFFALGEPYTAAVRPTSRPRAQFIGNTLLLETPGPTETPRLFEKALREKARRVFAERLALYAIRLCVNAPPLRLSSARTRWGSCSRHGGISLNWKLVFMPLPVVDYVVCHELAHLKEMNHSPRFWSVVEQLCPEWRVRRTELRQLGRQLPQFE